ncbi:hypothetical protein [Rhizorhabdus sp. FW153]|uniref:hypothetical protein n=1 Tax=Rhizorhabdus sp. FW153 TaxID=3400216 RepID=UPI003CF83D88
MTNIAIVLIGLFAIISAQKASEDMAGAQSPLDIFELIDKITSEPVVSYDTVERNMGIHLNLASEGVFNNYEAEDYHISGSILEKIEYRQPVVGSGASRGSILSIRIGGECVDRKEVILRYSDLAITDVPKGHSLDEQTYYSAAKPWGKISFGFSERVPDCLRTIVISVG